MTEPVNVVGSTLVMVGNEAYVLKEDFKKQGYSFQPKPEGGGTIFNETEVPDNNLKGATIDLALLQEIATKR